MESRKEIEKIKARLQKNLHNLESVLIGKGDTSEPIVWYGPYKIPNNWWENLHAPKPVHTIWINDQPINKNHCETCLVDDARKAWSEYKGDDNYTFYKEDQFIANWFLNGIYNILHGRNTSTIGFEGLILFMRGAAYFMGNEIHGREQAKQWLGSDKPHEAFLKYRKENLQHLEQCIQETIESYNHEQIPTLAGLPDISWERF